MEEQLGKREVWKVNLYTLWFTQVLVNMGFGLAVPFIPYYLEEMAEMTNAQLNLYTGLSSTLPSAAMALASPFWGYISDIYGRKMMLIRAMICGAVILALIGVADTVLIFLILRTLQGIFTGTIPASMALVSAHTPEDKMSYALGFMTSSNFLGYAMGPVIGSLVCGLFGYEVCFYVGGVLLAIGIFFVVFLVKEDAGTYGAALRQARLEAKQAAKERGGSSHMRLLTTNVLMTLTALLILRIGRTLFSPFIAVFVRDSLGTMDGATTYTGIINMAMCVATAVSSVTLTRLGDTYNKFKLAIILSIISFFVSALLPINYPLWVFTIMYALYYFVVGAIEPVLTSALSEETEPGQRGALFGMTGAVSSLGMMISPMVGATVSTAFSTRVILAVIPIFMLAQVIFLVIERKVQRRKQNAV